LLTLANQTVRERVRISVGGLRFRLRLSNEFNSAPLEVGEVTVALANGKAGVQPASLHVVTFAGSRSAVLPPGAPLLSDPVDFPLQAGTQISISIYLPRPVRSVTWHELALERAVVSGPGDHSHDTVIEVNAEAQSSILLSAVLVPARPSQKLIVAMGDSIVDGDRSTVDAGRSWPSQLERRIQGAGLGSRVAVVNEGIAGNRLLANGPVASLGESALARFDRDVLSLPGVTHIILLEGINDLGFPGAKLGSLALADAGDARTADDLVKAYRQLIARAHAHGIRVIGCTLTPFEGVDVPGYYSRAKDAEREKVNRWIRTSGAFDGTIDFDRVLRDPQHPGRLAPRLASSDHLHPNDSGYRAMAAAIDLTLFR
jgi:lysophospholipase L1-like esterase